MLSFVDEAESQSCVESGGAEVNAFFGVLGGLEQPVDMLGLQR